MSFGKAKRFTEIKDDNPSPAHYNVSAPQLNKSITIPKSPRFKDDKDEGSFCSRRSLSGSSSRRDSGHESSNSDHLSRSEIQKLKDRIMLFNRLELQKSGTNNEYEFPEEYYEDDLFNQTLKLNISSTFSLSTSKLQLSEIVYELTQVRKEYESLLAKHKDEVKKLMRAIEDLEKQMANKGQTQLCESQDSQEAKIKELEAKNRDIQNFYVKAMGDLYKSYENFIGELDVAVNEITKKPSESEGRMEQFDFNAFITKMESDVQHLQKCFEEEHTTFSKEVEEKLKILLELSSESKTRIHKVCNQMVDGWKDMIQQASDSSVIRKDSISKLETLKEKVLSQKAIINNMVSELDLS